uniref:Putative homing endonuclease n=1 Tax=viral metagenome TaxID=1070528 RepID=A0A6M3K672_9ZZZZ
MFKKGYKMSEEHKRRIGKANSIALKGKHCSPRTEFKKGTISYSKLHPEIMPRGKNHPQWKGGRYKDKTWGYIFVHKPNHPFADKRGYIREHRLIIEKQIGRYLHRWEVAHHINSIRNDNRPENLKVMSKSEHSHLHNSKGE